MQEQQDLSKLFQDKPGSWGLRGDPYLWEEMKDTLGACAYPATEEQFTKLVEQTYKQLTGVPLANQESIFIERYSHGGMSSGYVSPQFWIEKVLPLLQARYRQSK